MWLLLRSFFTTMGVRALILALGSFDVRAGESTIPQLEPNNPEDYVYLSDLLVSGSFEGVLVGDKIFDGFTYSQIGDVPSAENIKVLGLLVDGNWGIRLHGGFKDLFDDNNESSDALIEFDVSVINPKEYLISDVHLFGNPSLSMPGQSLNAFAEVVETVSSNQFGPLNLRIQDDLNGFVGSAWIDPLPSPVESLHVIKDIQLLSIDEVRSTISFVDQTFSQIPLGIPEPPTAILSLLASYAIFLGRRGNGWNERG